MAIYSDHVITLKSRAYRDHDALLTLFGAQTGKFGAIAKAVRRPKSKLQGQISPLTLSVVTLYHGRSTLDTVTEAELQQGFARIPESLDRLGWAMVIVDVVDQLLPEREPSEQSFYLLMSALEAFNAGRPPAAVGLAAGFRLLEVAGFGPDWENCSACHSGLESGPLQVDMLEGGVYCPNCAPRAVSGEVVTISLGSLRSLQYWLKEPPRKFGQADVKGTMRKELESLFFRYLMRHTGKSLKSQEFLSSINRLGKG